MFTFLRLSGFSTLILKSQQYRPKHRFFLCTMNAVNKRPINSYILKEYKFDEFSQPRFFTTSSPPAQPDP